MTTDPVEASINLISMRNDLAALDDWLARPANKNSEEYATKLEKAERLNAKYREYEAGKCD